MNTHSLHCLIAGLAAVRTTRRTLRGMLGFVLAAILFLPSSSAAEEGHSIARFWNEEIMAAIRIDRPHPPVHSRNLFTLSAAMYDCWAAYDPVAVGYIYHQKHTADDVAAARHEAISYAAYKILRERFSLSVNYVTTLGRLDQKLTSLGYDTNNVSLDVSTPAGLGNSVAAAISDWFYTDGSRQGQLYKDTFPELGGYAPANQPLVAGLSGIVVEDVNRWQPLAIANAVDQNGLPAGPIQIFAGSQWLHVRPFGLSREVTGRPWIDPGPPPFFNTESHAEFRDSIVQMIRTSSELDPADGVSIDISPGAIGNNSLGTNDGTGHPLNPVTGQPYAPNVVLRADFARVLAEYWADGPDSETPPGHWNVLANKIADHPRFEKRWGGTGEILDDLEWDVKVYFAMNAGAHDASCAAWSVKRFYDGWRPMSAVRYMGSLGQSSDPLLPAYNPLGLPLIPDLIELVTPDTGRIGGRHQGLSVNKLAIRSWPGQPLDPENQTSGVRWIRPTEWVPYQRATFVTPAFPGYISGHSTYSRTAAEILTAITGSPFFPDGMGTHTVPAGELIHEEGPTTDVQLQWATYFDAADQAGMSRIWGGIHPSPDDLNGRKTGSVVGKMTIALAQKYFDGTVANGMPLAIRDVSPNGCEVRYATVRGFRYKLQATPDLRLPFFDVGNGFVRAEGTVVITTNGLGSKNNFYRAIVSSN